MKLHSPQSAVLSAVHLQDLARDRGADPLALRGVKLPGRIVSGHLRRNVFIYGVGGIIVPFIFIKLIDLVLVRPPRLLMERF